MIDKEKDFKIIRLKADDRIYYPDSSDREDWMGDKYVKQSSIEIALGASRYGGPIIDLPKDVEHPADLRFVAQIDLSEASKFDSNGLLPKTGQLYFFADILSDKGKVIYSNTDNKDLIRTIKEHEDNFWSGVLITDFYSDTENMNERFIEEKKKGLFYNKTVKQWDYFAGSDKSKIFGIFTHCQQDQEYVEKISFSDKLVLLQIGEDGFNDEGVFTVLIDKSDLENKDFDNCEFTWGQS